MRLAVHLGTTFTQRICRFLQWLSIAWDDHLSVSISVLRVSSSFVHCCFVLREFSVNFQFCLSEKLRVEGQLEFLGALLSVLVNFEAEETLQF